ncbi:HEAT repeat domain-containing protein [Streptomyces decoyicus]|uniref:HEAT repeat domain-containing protein n=1 Tax=Streptomyces decoyicus TaxID=249567 RepID=UPI000A807B47|nr:HEAT repeat domain-containing protein [Streptomyces decoyicus]QZY19886.1 HEAT repeat domain-containing protein [Streptomyces decoyicus]
MSSMGDPHVAFAWQTVVYRDFDVELDEPGRRSGAALEALMADLGIPDDAEGFGLVGEWAEELSRTLTAGLPALLARLSHPDTAVRRILSVVFAYAYAPAEEVARALLAHSESDPDAPVRLGLLFALGLHCGHPEVRDHLRRRLQGEPADALGAALGLLLPPVAETDAEVIDEALEALTLCGGEAGEALAELAWCDPEWCGRPAAYGSVDAVDSWLTPTPGLRSRWLTRMLPGLWDGRLDASAAPVLVEAADRLFQQDRDAFADHAPAVASLLGHPDPRVRRAAVNTHHLPAHRTYTEALARILQDPDPGSIAGSGTGAASGSRPIAGSNADADADSDVFERALGVLARRGDPRCIPPIQHRIRQGTVHAGLLRATAELADHLWPHIRARLGHDLPAAEVCSLLTGTSAWPGGAPALPQVVTTLEGLSRRIDATDSPEFDVLEAASAACTFLRKWGLSDAAALSTLRRLARTADLELGLAAIRTLMGPGESSDDEVVPLLLNVLARRDRPGRVAGRRGWRFDTNACAWLGELGPRALSASPALSRLRDTATEAGELRVAAASALWEITGDASAAVPVLHGYATAEGPAAARARDALRRIERTSPGASGTKA